MESESGAFAGTVLRHGFRLNPHPICLTVAAVIRTRRNAAVESVVCGPSAFRIMIQVIAVLLEPVGLARCP